ncbi:MAG: hypothetical protein E7573_05825 [Ruminococcaceae bacterium]|nr:hypothetical protein [Oscillospiraceae bacterium]MBR3595969.1 hypothetical protein [Clostridia bacterium]
MAKNNDDIVISREENKKIRKTADKKPVSTKTIGVCVLVLILLMALSAVVSELSGISIADIASERASGELIYDSLPDSIKNMESYSSGTVLLTDTSVDYLDSGGRLLSSNSHLYSQPVMKVNKSTVLLYDRGGTAFRIERNSDIYNTYTVSGAITTAALGKKNNYAYVLNDEGGFQSHLYVYSYQGKKQFEWGSASEYCAGVALSDNGKNVALSMLGVENGEYYSKVIFFNFRGSEPVYSVKFTDSTVFGLDFVNNKTVAALTDNGIFVINNDGQYETVCEYSPAEIKHSSFETSDIKAFAVANHGNEKDTDVVIFNKKYAELFRVNTDTEVISLASSERFTAVLFSNEVKIYSDTNTPIGSILLGEKCIDAAFSGRTLYVRTVSGIYSFDADADTDLTQKKSEEETAATENKTEIPAVNEYDTTESSGTEEATEASTSAVSYG